jgi:glycosyltransferase involved in cell wall biosynthesis
MFFKLSRGSTWQLAEVGFLLRNGEFLAAARSQAVPFASSVASPRGGHAALLVDGCGRVEDVGNVWEQEGILRQRRQPRLRQPLRLAAFAFASLPSGQDSTLARFVTELAAGQATRGHEVHVFVPAGPQLDASRQVDGVHYHPLPLESAQTPPEAARAFGRAAEARLADLPPFDLIHLHEWMTWLVPRTACPTVLSLGSIEATRRNGAEPSPLSLEIERAERAAAQAADCILTPEWLRARAAFALDVEAERLRAFPMEGRMPNEWEAPLDIGRVKMDIGFGPLDRLMLFVGPLEHAAGADLLVEAMPTVLHRAGNVRLAVVGAGHMYGHLEHRARQLGVAHAVHLLGHVEGPTLARLLRSAEALVLPSRHRLPFDEGVVDLARRAGRPVVTTCGGPSHLVRHEENGIVTYDNPGSMVWAFDRILSDPAHAERMGQKARRADGPTVVWSEVARHYLELCAAEFPELIETDW